MTITIRAQEYIYGIEDQWTVPHIDHTRRERERVQGVIDQVEIDLEAVEQRLMLLSKHRLDYLRKMCGVVRSKKYPSKNTRPKYGNLPRVMNNEQLKRFFAELYRFKNVDVYTAFCRQFFYGLRVGEIASAEIVPNQRMVRVVNHKAKRIEYLPLIPGTEVLFRALNKGKAYDPNYLRKYFRETCQRLGDEYMYTYGYNTKGKCLQQFSTHSLRKTAGNLLREYTKEPYKESVYLRHETSHLYGTTAYYMHYSMKDMEKDLARCFQKLVHDLVTVKFNGK